MLNKLRAAICAQVNPRGGKAAPLSGQQKGLNPNYNLSKKNLKLWTGRKGYLFNLLNLLELNFPLWPILKY